MHNNNVAQRLWLPDAILPRRSRTSDAGLAADALAYLSSGHRGLEARIEHLRTYRVYRRMLLVTEACQDGSNCDSESDDDGGVPPSSHAT